MWMPRVSAVDPAVPSGLAGRAGGWTMLLRGGTRPRSQTFVADDQP